MFRTIFIAVWAVFHIYVFWRVGTLPAVRRLIPWYMVAGVAVVLWSTFLAPRFLRDSMSRSLASKIEIVGDQWLGVVFLLFCSLLVADIVTGFGFLIRQHAPLMRTLGLTTGILLSMIAFVQGMRAPVVNGYEVTMENLPPEAEGLTIAALSDLHIGATLGKDWLESRVAQVNSMQPDAIVILGDIIEGYSAVEGAPSMKSAFAKLHAPLGIWAVLGNHDHHSGPSSTATLLQDAGIRVLRNEWTEMRPGLVIAGVDDRRGPGSGGQEDRIRQALSGRPPGTAAVFLSHRPEAVDQVADLGVELMLSGHTHGGQIWPFTYIVKTLNSLMDGRHVRDGLTIIVSRGTGTWGPRMRLWKPGEVILITLQLP